MLPSPIRTIPMALALALALALLVITPSQALISNPALSKLQPTAAPSSVAKQSGHRKSFSSKPSLNAIHSALTSAASFVLSANGDPSPNSLVATVSTDKNDYSPGETVVITGTGWLPGETVVMVLHETPLTHPDITLTSIADANGNFTNTDFTVQAHDLKVAFTLTATGQTSGKTAMTTFTDAVGIQFRHSTCIGMPISAFCLGDTVCAKATGLGNDDHVMKWFDPSNVLKRTSPIINNGNSDDLYTPDSTGTWTVKVFSSPGGIEEASETFTVSNCTTPACTTANAGTDQTICSTGSAMLAANNPAVGTGAWSVVAGSPSTSTSQFSSVTDQNATFTPAGGPGTYTLRWTISGACMPSSDDVVITVNAAATVNAGPDQTITAGNAAMLAGSIGGSAMSATWSGGTGTFTPNNTTLNASYKPSAAEVAAGMVTLTLTTDDPAGACGAVSDTVKITIDKFSGKLTDPIACVGPGGIVNVTATVTNNGPAGASNFTATLDAQLLAVPGTCSAVDAATNLPLGTCTVVNASTVTWNSTPPGTLGTGQTVTITYLAQVANGTPPGTQLCINSTANIAGAGPFTVTTCTTVNCPVAGPGVPPPAAAEVAGQKPGSVLFYNIFTSNPTNLNQQNTRINLTNTGPQSVAVHLFSVDGSNCSPADAFICLTSNQTISFLASDFDPGTTGYIIAIASDPLTGCPINYNFLIGDEFVKFSSEHEANLLAEAFAALAGTPPLCPTGTTSVTLNFDGVQYNRVPRVLAVDNFPSRADGNDTLLILNRFGGDLTTSGDPIGIVTGVFYNESEQPFSFTFTADSCQFRNSLSNNFPRILQRLDMVVSSGRSGWMRFWATDTSGRRASDVGLLGAMIIYNTSAGANSFNQGHNLHKLTFTSASLTIPIIVPAC